jgi:hypothetical protein
VANHLCCAASSPPRATRRTASRAPPPMYTSAPLRTGRSVMRDEGRGVGGRHQGRPRLHLKYLRGVATIRPHSTFCM